MRILVHGLNYSPELIGVGKYTGEFVEWLASRGYEVLVVTAPPYYPHWKVQEGYSKYWYTNESSGNIRIIRCPLWVPRKQTGVRRIFHLFSFAVLSMPVIIWKAIQFHPSHVVVIAPTILCAPGGIIASRLVRAISWIHFQDIEIDAAFGISFLRGKLIQKLVRKVETRILRAFDRVSSISVTMVERLIEKGCPPEKTLDFPNWVDTSSIFPIKDKQRLREGFGFDSNAFIVLYSGNLGAKQGLHLLIEAARLLTDHPAIHFVIAGDGSYRETLRRLAIGLKNVTFLHLQPAMLFNSFLNTADVHIVSQLSGVGDAVMPSKLLGILAAGGAVVAILRRGTALASVIEDAGGIPVLQEDPKSISDVLISLYADRDRLQRMRIRAREYALEHYDKTKILENIEEQMQLFHS